MSIIPSGTHAAIVSCLVSVWLALAFPVAKQEPPKAKIPESGVPQIMAIEGAFVRAASRGCSSTSA